MEFLRQEEEEKERQRKEEEERQRRDEEERKRKEEEERIRLEEQKARVNDEVEPVPEIDGTRITDNPLTPKLDDELPSSKDDAEEKSGGSLYINSAMSASPFDLTHSRQPSSLLALARPLEDFGSVTYPAGISSPDPELNAGAKEGKFRYVNHRL